MHTSIFHHNTNNTTSARNIRWMQWTAAAFIAISLSFLVSLTVHAADTRAVTVSSSNNSLGAVFCTHNGASFEHYTYAEPTDYITVNALPVNKNYNFLNWTDNGVIVSNNSTYSFSVKDQNHVIVAHFDAKPEMKHKRYDPDKNISSITRNTNACVFAPGYKIDGMTINTALIPLDETTENAVEAMTGGSFTGAFRIQFTFGYEGKEKQTLDNTTQVTLKLPSYRAGTCHIISLAGASPVILDDLDNDEKTVTFEIKDSGLYVVTCTDAAPAVPAMPGLPAVPAAEVPAAPGTVPESAPEVPASPVITEEQYQEMIANILRYQLQQEGITPAV